MKKYFQTWAWNAKLKRKCKLCAKAWQWLCGLLGHEPSKTEWGYGGGDKADAYCRWCNKHMQMSRTELMFRLPKDERELLKLIRR